MKKMYFILVALLMSAGYAFAQLNPNLMEREFAQFKGGADFDASTQTITFSGGWSGAAWNFWDPNDYAQLGEYTTCTIQIEPVDFWVQVSIADWNNGGVIIDKQGFDETGKCVIKVASATEISIESGQDGGQVKLISATLSKGGGGEPGCTNLFVANNFTLGGPYFAPGWNNSSNYTATWEGGVLTLALNDATYEMWQAQFPLQSESTPLVEGNTYSLSYDIETNVDLPRAYMKVYKDGDDNHFIDIPSLSVPAGKQTVSNDFENTGTTVITEFNKVLFDFGGNPANTQIVISNITICDKSGANIIKVKAPTSQAYGITGGIRVNAPNQNVSIYQIDGLLVKQVAGAISQTIGLSKGLYIVKIGTAKAVKVLVK